MTPGSDVPPAPSSMIFRSASSARVFAQANPPAWARSDALFAIEIASPPFSSFSSTYAHSTSARTPVSILTVLLTRFSIPIRRLRASFTTSRGRLMRAVLISEMCTSPSMPGSTSTNAPYSASRVMVPLTTVPGG